MDTFPFRLALDLHKTLGELDHMPRREYLAWRAFYTYRAAMTEFEQNRRP